MIFFFFCKDVEGKKIWEGGEEGREKEVIRYSKWCGSLYFILKCSMLRRVSTWGFGI